MTNKLKHGTFSGTDSALPFAKARPVYRRYEEEFSSNSYYGRF